MALLHTRPAHLCIVRAWCACCYRHLCEQQYCQQFDWIWKPWGGRIQWQFGRWSFPLCILVSWTQLVFDLIFWMQSDRAVLNLWKCFYLTGQENRKWAVLAVIAWCVRGSSHVISLVLIFNVAMKDGLLHAVYSKHCMTQISCQENELILMLELPWVFLPCHNWK